jgi:hypothetical protein
MPVMVRSLKDPESWQIGYDTDARRLYVECPTDTKKKQFAVNDFLAQDRGQQAQDTLIGMFVDMFPNIPEDADPGE